MTFSVLPPSSSDNINLAAAPANGVVDVSLAAHRKPKPSAFHSPEVRIIVQISLALAFVFSLFLFDDSVTGDVASLSLQIGDQRRYFVGEVTDSMTVLDAISAASLAGNFRFAFASADDGRVDILNLLTDSNPDEISRKYAFFLNGQKINPDDISSIPVKPNDSIVVKVLMSRP